MPEHVLALDSSALDPRPAAPSFRMLHSEPPRKGAFLLGALGSLLALSAVMATLGHTGRTARRSHATPGAPSTASAGAPASGVPAAGDDSDDDFDTIVLADPSDAPTPVRKGNHVSDVHPFAVVHLPRFGDALGTIPDTPAGRALYAWLAAFNHTDGPALAAALPTAYPADAVAAQLDLREATGGLALLSAREIAPGLMVFRMRDQVTQTEVLGTLELRSTSPPGVASFSLRAVRTPVPPAIPQVPPVQRVPSHDNRA